MEPHSSQIGPQLLPSRHLPVPVLPANSSAAHHPHPFSMHLSQSVSREHSNPESKQSSGKSKEGIGAAPGGQGSWQSFTCSRYSSVSITGKRQPNKVTGTTRPGSATETLAVLRAPHRCFFPQMFLHVPAWKSQRYHRRNSGSATWIVGQPARWFRPICRLAKETHMRQLSPHAWLSADGPSSAEEAHADAPPPVEISSVTMACSSWANRRPTRTTSEQPSSSMSAQISSMPKTRSAWGIPDVHSDRLSHRKCSCAQRTSPSTASVSSMTGRRTRIITWATPSA